MSAASGPVDALYFQASTVQKNRYVRGDDEWNAYDRFPAALPAAKAYWAVFRFEDHSIPDVASIRVVMRVWRELQNEAVGRGVRLAGLQLDIDCPTAGLGRYAAYLRELRKAMPADAQLSITALLDWFRTGTAMSDVAGEVDEFVPQFYDLGNPGAITAQPVIAAPIEASKWGPVFNKFGRRFRIGVSTFGRSRYINAGRVISQGDLRPFDFGADPAFRLSTERTPAQELVLRYTATRPTRVGYQDLGGGEAIEFVVPTPEAVRAAVAEARKMGEYCGGVVFFRWPMLNESLAAAPDEVLAPEVKREANLRVVDQQCAAVQCVDLLLSGTPPLAPSPTRIAVTSSADLEYFLPDKEVPVRMTGARRLELTLPPYAGRLQLHLGRAVAAREAKYTLEVRP